MEKLDAICMQLIAIGESLKNLDKVTSHTLLPQHANVDWQKVKGMRDVISYHYFDVDAEIVYAVCANEIGNLIQAVQNMMAELKK